MKSPSSKYNRFLMASIRLCSVTLRVSLLGPERIHLFGFWGSHIFFHLPLVFSYHQQYALSRQSNQPCRRSTNVPDVVKISLRQTVNSRTIVKNADKTRRAKSYHRNDPTLPQQMPVPQNTSASLHEVNQHHYQLRQAAVHIR